MTHPLIERLTTEFGYPRLRTAEAVTVFGKRPGVHCLFVPGDPAKNLESTDAAVILPELVQAFQGAFDCAVVDESIDYAVREAAGVFKTPLMIFLREGGQIGTIPKVRDWDDYLARISRILATEAPEIAPETEGAA